MKTGTYGYGVDIQEDGAHWFVWKGDPQNIIEKAQVPLQYTDAEAAGAKRMLELEEALGLQPKSREIQKLFSNWCDAEVALEAALDKLHGAGHECSHECYEGENPVVELNISGRDNPLRCLDCGGYLIEAYPSKLAQELCDILSKHCGERGDNEGAVKTLERLLKEKAQFEFEASAIDPRVTMLEELEEWNGNRDMNLTEWIIKQREAMKPQPCEKAPEPPEDTEEVSFKKSKKA